ncbi:general secretion pathway protein GspF [Simiduia sp. 21SJ11W-1]|uniref:general secretion pathway protein GspF n=1 Tax=Simiduia sp. 21SJ11W-1 TaxID=2909669 RepID=UPI0020A067A5|nr:general secretion pathway protein GspF [Simiduia sp. 21SJ11W-1]UTA47888.1 general secretion pathway protein GspF [Simiduia sp. 21SJ11W-1]
MSQKFKKDFQPDEALITPNMHKPVSRRDMLAQGFKLGAGAVVGSTALGLLSANAYGDLSPDLLTKLDECEIPLNGSGKIPFICFDLAGGANFAGSNVLIGGRGGQLDFLSTAGYGKQGLPGDMVPSSSTANFIDESLGLRFHTDSAMLRGILEKAITAAPATNGAVIPARSENDTGNNPHNPMYGINKAGAFGNLVALVGSRSSDSGGNSMAPAAMIDPAVRPTKVDRPSDVTGLVDVGSLTELLSKDEIVKVMETMYRVSDKKIARIDTGLTADEQTAVEETLRCQYVKSAHLANTFGNPADLNPELDLDLVGPNGVFSAAEFASDGEFRKTASVAKMVINGYAGAGTITMGGYDYHTGDRATGERRDLRAGRCIGAVLEYAAKVGVPVMIYVCSDGSVFSNGMLDNSEDGAGKGVWTGDNQQTASAFFLVYNPGGRPQLLGATMDEQETHRQIGWMRPSGDVETASSVAANNVNLLVETVVLNYMALHGEQANFANADKFPQNGLGTNLDALTAFQPICNGVYTNPV